MTSQRMRNIAWSARLGGVVVAAILLAGCMTSRRAMFTAPTAVHQLEPGRYRLFERNGSTFSPSDRIEVRNGADGAYDFVDEQAKATAISLHPIGGGRFVAQGSEKDGFMYAVFEIGPRGVTIYTPDCDKQDKAGMAALGVKVDNHECRIDRVADPAAFFRTIDLGEPTSRMERE